MKYRSVAVVGIGLIGGSVCRALKEYGVSKEVIGIDPNRKALQFAVKEGIVDKALAEPSGMINSEIVIVATYVDIIPEIIEKVLPYLRENCVITDVGSVKSKVVNKVNKLLIGKKISFIGSHPISGKERSGVENSEPNLFKGNKVIITSTSSSDQAAVEKITDFWTLLGAEVVSLDPDLHDRVFAYVSHLPHLVAYSLVNSVASADFVKDGIFSYAGGGLRDYTRVSASSPEMWKTIFLQNKDHILESLGAFKLNIEKLESALMNEDTDELLHILENAQKIKLSE